MYKGVCTLCGKEIFRPTREEVTKENCPRCLGRIMAIGDNHPATVPTAGKLDAIPDDENTIFCRGFVSGFYAGLKESQKKHSTMKFKGLDKAAKALDRLQKDLQSFRVQL